MSKHALIPQRIAHNQSLAASFNSTVSTPTYQDNISYQINITTTDSIGDFYLQGSNDNVNWADTGNTITVNAVNDVGLINVNQWPFNYIRLRYDSSTAGTGTVDVWYMHRSIGA